MTTTITIVVTKNVNSKYGENMMKQFNLHLKTENMTEYAYVIKQVKKSQRDA